MARRYKTNPCMMNRGRKNPWYVVGRPNLEVASGFPHFTEESSTDEVLAYEETSLRAGRPRRFEAIYTDKAVEPGDLLARDGRVVTRKSLGLENPYIKGKPKMWFPTKGSEAAKDLGGLLQKMRKATPEEKEKLKALYKKTREKWMARDGLPAGRTSAPKAKKNPWYNVYTANGQVVESDVHFTEESAKQRAKEIMGDMARPISIGPRYAKKPAFFADIIHEDGSVHYRLGHGKRKNPYYVVDETGDMPSGAPHDDIKTAELEAARLAEWHPEHKYSVAYDDEEGPYEGRKNPLAEAVVSGVAGGMVMSALKNPEKRFRKHEKGCRGDCRFCEQKEVDAHYEEMDRADRVALKESKEKNPYYVTNKDFTVVSRPHKSKRSARESKTGFNFFAKAMGDGRGGGERYGFPYHVIETPKEKKEGDYVFDNPHLVIVGNPQNGIPLPKALERQVLRAPAKDRPELLKGIEKYHEFHGCFPKKIVQRDVDHSKVGLPLVNVGLGWSDNVEYRSTNAASNKFFAGGKGKYVHKFGDELPKEQRKGAKPLLVTDPTGKTLHYLPSKFKVKDWIHH